MAHLVSEFDLSTRKARRLSISHGMIQPLFVLFDATAILLASVLGLVVYYFLRADFMDLESYAGVDIFAISVYAASASYFRLYRFRQLNRSGLEFKSVLVSWAAVLFCLTVCLFLMKLGSHVSRATITAFLVIALPSLLISRSISKSFFKTAIQTSLIRGRRAIVVGTHDELVSISQEHLLSHYGIDEGERITLPAREANESHTEAVAREAAGRARIIRAGEVVLALPWDDDVRLRLVLKHLRTLPIPASLLPDRSARSLLEGHNSTFAEELLIPVKRAPLGPFARLAKRSFDTVIAAGLILAFSPVMIVAALAIRLDSKGPVIFRQQRRGFNGETFVIYKFRTMSVMEDGGKIIQAKKGDPRLTRVGGLLRRSSIDELPQLFNVLKGDMSLVGPRPHALTHDDEFSALVAEYAFRHHVKPGITGLAQVNGFRGEMRCFDDLKQRIDYDLKYVNNWSFLLDLQILARTSLATVIAKNAH